MRKTVCSTTVAMVMCFCSSAWAVTVEGVWKYTTDQPDKGWNLPGFEENKNCPWKSGKGGFGKVGTPGGRVSTLWRTPDIWMRTTYSPPKGLDLKKLSLEVCHDEDF